MCEQVTVRRLENKLDKAWREIDRLMGIISTQADTIAELQLRSQEKP